MARVSPALARSNNSADGARAFESVGTEHLRERIRERVGSERLARHSGRLQQRQPGERPGHPGGVGLDDTVVVDRKPHDCELLTACGISEDLEHRSSLAAEKSAPTLPMLPCADANLP